MAGGAAPARVTAIGPGTLPTHAAGSTEGTDRPPLDPRVRPWSPPTGMFHVKHKDTPTEAAASPGRRRVLAYGTVQGVGFRWFVSRHARSLGLAGHVLNRPDGTVEVEAAGDPDDLDSLFHTVAHGPPDARVDRVETLEPSTARLPSPFAIVHHGDRPN